MTFSDLGLSADLLRAIEAQGYNEPTPIQREAIPAVLAGRDLMAFAQTGTGKTAAFVLPMLHRLSQQSDSPLQRMGKTPRGLVLVPTRELAMQVAESVRIYGKFLKLRSCAIYGGTSIRSQIQFLRRGADLLVATPGRLLDHLNQKTVDLRTVEFIVLDEADRMLDMGFIRDIQKILSCLPAQRQGLLFSATITDDIRRLASNLLHEPQSIELAPRNAASQNVQQSVIHVDRDKKREALLHLFDQHGWNQVLIFTRTKHGAETLAQKLDRAGIRADALHGDKSQGARARALASFKAGRVSVLVATDVASRGIDINDLPRVINFELPNTPEDYVHRIGRTGRAGAHGEALSLVSQDERHLLRNIERTIKREIDKIALPGYEPVRSAADHQDPARRQRRHHSKPGQQPSHWRGDRRTNSSAPKQRTREGARRFNKD